ncbi:unnamed protein product [Triticum turgidum subsp. durum]|uniref:Acireductone dioxygenase n=1 Tax=Triticum turgidum subsp. durum TaxID=4567 RepID=A0A9R0QJ13_TRITD|nr:unnamed protein product [Triticum turgidum subsp. durum]
MALQVWMVGEDGEDLDNHKELLPLSKLQGTCHFKIGKLITPCFLSKPCAATCKLVICVTGILQLRQLPLREIEIGVLYWHLDPKKSESEEELAKIRKDRGYNYMDYLDICPGKLANFEEKLKNFFTEHMHADEEIRYCLEGGGYFDVRDKDDKWVRIWIKEGDMIVLPAGIYHRFTLDAANHVKDQKGKKNKILNWQHKFANLDSAFKLSRKKLYLASDINWILIILMPRRAQLMRLFLGEPVWTAHNRPQEDHPVRQEYVKRLTDDNAGLALAAH